MRGSVKWVEWGLMTDDAGHFFFAVSDYTEIISGDFFLLQHLIQLLNIMIMVIWVYWYKTTSQSFHLLALGTTA